MGCSTKCALLRAVKGCLYQRRGVLTGQSLLEPILLPATLVKHWWTRNLRKATAPQWRCGCPPLARILGPHPRGRSSSAAIQLLPPSGLPPQTRKDNCPRTAERRQAASGSGCLALRAKRSMARCWVGVYRISRPLMPQQSSHTTAWF